MDHLQPFCHFTVVFSYSHCMEASFDRDLIEQAKRDPEAFGRLFDIYHPQILRYCIHRTGDVEYGRDLAAQTFLKALMKLWQFRWHGIPFSAWLYRIATNEINDHFRSKRMLSLDHLLDTQGFEVTDERDFRQELIEAQIELEQHEQFLALLQELKTLSLKYQEVISLRFFEDKSIAEIATILGKREGTIKSLLSRGLAYLRKTMQPVPLSPVVQMKVENFHSLDDV